MEKTRSRRRVVQMCPAVRKAASWARYWYKPATVAVISPFSVVVVLNHFKLTLPWFLTHPISLVYMAGITLAYIWVKYRRIIGAVVLITIFICSSNRVRTEINNTFKRG